MFKRKFKKAIGIALLGAMLAGVAAIPAFAKEGTASENAELEPTGDNIGDLALSYYPEKSGADFVKNARVEFSGNEINIYSPEGSVIQEEPQEWVDGGKDIKPYDRRVNQVQYPSKCFALKVLNNDTDENLLSLSNSVAGIYEVHPKYISLCLCSYGTTTLTVRNGEGDKHEKCVYKIKHIKSGDVPTPTPAPTPTPSEVTISVDKVEPEQEYTVLPAAESQYKCKELQLSPESALIAQGTIIHLSSTGSVARWTAIDKTIVDILSKDENTATLCLVNPGTTAIFASSGSSSDILCITWAVAEEVITVTRSPEDDTIGGDANITGSLETGIRINGDDDDVVDSYLAFEASSNIADELLWESSNPSVAEIDGYMSAMFPGKVFVKILKRGYTEITVTGKNTVEVFSIEFADVTNEVDVYDVVLNTYTDETASFRVDTDKEGIWWLTLPDKIDEYVEAEYSDGWVTLSLTEEGRLVNGKPKMNKDGSYAASQKANTKGKSYSKMSLSYEKDSYEYESDPFKVTIVSIPPDPVTIKKNEKVNLALKENIVDGYGTVFFPVIEGSDPATVEPILTEANVNVFMPDCIYEDDGIRLMVQDFSDGMYSDGIKAFISGSEKMANWNKIKFEVTYGYAPEGFRWVDPMYPNYPYSYETADMSIAYCCTAPATKDISVIRMSNTGDIKTPIYVKDGNEYRFLPITQWDSLDGKDGYGLYIDDSSSGLLIEQETKSAKGMKLYSRNYNVPLSLKVSISEKNGGSLTPTLALSKSTVTFNRKDPADRTAVVNVSIKEAGWNIRSVSIDGNKKEISWTVLDGEDGMSKDLVLGFNGSSNNSALTYKISAVATIGNTKSLSKTMKLTVKKTNSEPKANLSNKKGNLDTALVNECITYTLKISNSINTIDDIDYIEILPQKNSDKYASCFGAEVYGNTFTIWQIPDLYGESQLKAKKKYNLKARIVFNDGTSITTPGFTISPVHTTSKDGKI